MAYNMGVIIAFIVFYMFRDSTAQFMKRHLAHQPIPLLLVKRLVPVLHQSNTSLTAPVGHCPYLLWIFPCHYLKEQVKHIVIQCAVIILPIRIQHIPHRHQHLIIRTTRDKPVRDTNPLRRPLRSILKQEQIRIQVFFNR